MPFILAQVRIPYDSGLPTDVTVNTFSFEVADVGNSALAVVATRLANFYNVVGPGAVVPVADNLAGTVNGAQARLKMYNRASPQPRAPIFDAPMPVLNQAVQSIPSEVALCGSFRGPLTSGVPPARRRGRVFIGPLKTAVVDQQNSSPVRPTETAMLSILGGLRGLMDASDEVADFGIWSQVGAGSFITAVHAWVDDAFDTMRSRGPAPLNRRSADRSASL